MLQLKVIQGLISFSIIKEYKKIRSFDKKHTFQNIIEPINTTRRAVKKVDAVFESVQIDEQ